MNSVISDVLWLVATSSSFYGLAVHIARLIPLSTGRLRLAFWYFTLAGFFVMPRLPVVSSRMPLLVVSTAVMAVRAAVPYGRIFMYVLTAGTCLRLAYLAIGVWRLRSMVRHACPWMPGDGAISAPVLVTPGIAVPASYGLRRPVILVPESWPERSPEAREAALAHETIHIGRLDWLAQMAEEVLIAVFWFNPAVYALVRRIRLAREQLVDVLAIDITSKPEQYLLALISFAAVEPQFIPATSFTAAEQLKQRIEAIQKESTMPNRKTNRNLFPALALLAFAAVLTTWSLPLRSAVVAQKDAELGDVYKIGDGVQPPMIVTKVEPQYAPAAKSAKIQGTVVMAVLIDKDGSPRTVQVKKSLDADLDQNAIDAVKQWRFRPALLNGNPVAVEATIEVNFRLLDDKK